MTRHLEAALSPSEFSRVRASDGGRTGARVRMMKSEGQMGQHAACS